MIADLLTALIFCLGVIAFFALFAKGITWSLLKLTGQDYAKAMQDDRADYCRPDCRYDLLCSSDGGCVMKRQKAVIRRPISETNRYDRRK